MNRNAALFWPDVPGLGPDVVAGQGRRRARAADLSRGRALHARRRADAGLGGARCAQPFPDRPARASLATALLVNTGNYALLFWGIARAPTGLAAIVNFATIPVFSLLASRWLEGEPIARRQRRRDRARHARPHAAVRHARAGRARRGGGGAGRAVGAGCDRARHPALLRRRRAVAADRRDDAGAHARRLADADRRHRPERAVAGARAGRGQAPARARDLADLAGARCFSSSPARSSASRSTCGCCATGAPFAPGSTPSSAR